MANGSSGSLVEYPHLYIGGAWVSPSDGGIADSIDPATGQAWARVAYGGAADIDAAVAAAREAFGPWSRRPGHERAAMLRRLADLYEKAAPALARLETQDNGRALRESRADAGSHASGWGRENGIESLDGYLDTQTTIISTTGEFPDPFAN